MEKQGFRGKRKLSSQALSPAARLAHLPPSLQPALGEAGVSAAATAWTGASLRELEALAGYTRPPQASASWLQTPPGPPGLEGAWRPAAALRLPGSTSDVPSSSSLSGTNVPPSLSSPSGTDTLPSPHPCGVCSGFPLLHLAHPLGSHLSPRPVRPGKQDLARAPPLAPSRGSVDTLDIELTRGRWTDTVCRWAGGGSGRRTGLPCVNTHSMCLSLFCFVFSFKEDAQAPSSRSSALQRRPPQSPQPNRWLTAPGGFKSHPLSSRPWLCGPWALSSPPGRPVLAPQLARLKTGRGTSPLPSLPPAACPGPPKRRIFSGVSVPCAIMMMKMI